MNILIKIETDTINGETVQTVNARDLHDFLGSRKEFANWIRDRIEQYGFIEGVDFLPIQAKTSHGRPLKEYHLSIEMAKEISMVERNLKGKEARQYFLAMEKIAKQVKPPKEPTVLELLEMGANSERQRLILVQKNLQLEHKIEKDRPDVEFSQFVKCLHGSITVAEAAKILGTGAKRLFKLLRAYGWVNEKNEPYQNVLDKKLLDFKIEKTRHKDYGLQEYTRTLVTAHGLFALQKMYRDEKYPLFAD